MLVIEEQGGDSRLQGGCIGIGLRHDNLGEIAGTNSSFHSIDRIGSNEYLSLVLLRRDGVTLDFHFCLLSKAIRYDHDDVRSAFFHLLQCGLVGRLHSTETEVVALLNAMNKA